jgi:hypothetical protein
LSTSFWWHAPRRVSSNVGVANACCCRDTTKNFCPSAAYGGGDQLETKAATAKNLLGLCPLWDRQLNSLRDISSSKDLALLSLIVTGILTRKTEVFGKENLT